MAHNHSTEHFVPAVLRLLQHLQRDASTPKGERTILQQFNKKIERVGGKHEFIEKLRLMYDYFIDPHTSRKQKVWIGAALLYFIMPMDVIVDVVPGLGWLDDGVAALFVWNLMRHEMNRYERRRKKEHEGVDCRQRTINSG